MDNEQSMSPTPIKAVEYVDFYTALRAVADGAHITKAEWENNNIYGYLQDERVKLFKEDGKAYDWIISEADLVGQDWIVL